MHTATCRRSLGVLKLLIRSRVLARTDGHSGRSSLQQFLSRFLQHYEVEQINMGNVPSTVPLPTSIAEFVPELFSALISDGCPRST